CRDHAEEGGNLQLLQQVFGRKEARRIEAAENQQRDDAGKGGRHRRVDVAQEFRHAARSTARCRRIAHPNHSSRFLTRNSANAPRLTATSRTTPWKSGCHSGSKTKTKSRSPMVRKAKAPKMAPMALPRPPNSDTPPSTTAAIENNV